LPDPKLTLQVANVSRIKRGHSLIGGWRSSLKRLKPALPLNVDSSLCRLAHKALWAASTD
jgi:hypothetical protein